MISNYNTFLGERLFENVVNESMIYYTKEFKDALYKLSLKSPIAKALIDVEYTDVKPDMTFIGMSDKEGNFTFTQINKAINSLKKSVDVFSKAHDLEPDSIKFGNGDTISSIYKKVEDGTISQSDVNHLYNNHPWDLKDKARSDAKIGKLVNKIFPDKYNSKEIEEFTNLFKKVGEDESNFTLITGEDIRYWYNEDRYQELSGELGNSCMRHRRCSNYFNIYVENPDTCRLLILKSETNEEKIRGRVLIWKINELEEGAFEDDVEYYMDRIYAIDDATKSMFEDYADKQGWLKRLTSRYSDTKDFKLGEMIAKNIDLDVKLSKWKFDQYPYMDTFKKLDVDNGLLINDEDYDSDYGHYYIMTDTGGEYDDTSGKWSTWFDCRIPEADALWSEPLGDWIYGDGAIEVEYGSSRYLGWYPDEYDNILIDCVTGNWIHEQDSIYSEYYDDSFLAEDAMECITWIDDSSNLKECITSTETISDQDDQTVIIGDMECWEYLEKFEHDSDYISKSVVNKSERNNKYYFNDHSIRVYYTSDGEFIQEDCNALDLKITEKYYWTDVFTYNYKMDLNTKSKIKNALKEKISTLENVISGKQTRLVFDDDTLSDEDWMKGKKWLLAQLKRRLDVIKEWL